MPLSRPTPARLVLTVVFTVTALSLGIIGAVAAGTGGPPPRIAFVAAGGNFPDALAVGPMAGRLGAPLFLTPTDALNEQTEDALVAYGADLIVVAGGPNTVHDSVVAAMSSATGLPIREFDDKPTSGIVRAFGSGREATAAKLADLLTNYNAAYQSRVVGTISVTSVSAVPRSSSTTTAQVSGPPGFIGRHSTGGGDDFLIADVPLPDGATITRITAVAKDSHATLDSCFYLYTSIAPHEVVDVGCSTGADNNALQTIEKTTSVVIDGSLGYYVYMGIHSDAAHQLVPVQVTFEYILG